MPIFDVSSKNKEALLVEIRLAELILNDTYAPYLSDSNEILTILVHNMVSIIV